MKDFKHILPVALVLAIFIVVFASVVTLNKIEKNEKENINYYLETILVTAHQGFQSWADRNKKNCEVWADEMMPLIKKLLEVQPTKEALLQSEIQEKLREKLLPFYADDDYEGFFVINPDNISIASSRDSNTGIPNLLENQGDVLTKMWAGETVLTMPMVSDVPLPGSNQNLKENRATMFVGTPVKDENGKIIALFTFRINPYDDFTAIFERAHVGDSGETYCINSVGKMMSNSRFNSELLSRKLLKKGENAILNLYVTVPSKGSAENSKNLTKMAKRLTNKESGSDLKGYSNYLGEKVIGAWMWDDEYDFGIASEMSKREAFVGVRNIRIAVITLTGVIIVLLIGLILLFQNLNSRISKSERKYRVFFEDSPLGIYQITSSGKILNANPALIQMLDCNSIDELQEQLADMLQVDLKLFNDDNTIQKVDNSEFVKGIEESWETKKNRIIHIRENLRIVRNREGRVDYYEAIVEDITAKKIANQQIRKLNEELELKVQARTSELEAINTSLKTEINTRKSAEERSRLIFDSSPYSIMLVDSRGIINLANSVSEEYFGYTGAELVGTNILSVFSEKENHANDISFEAFFEKPKVQKFGDENDLFASRKDGSLFPVELAIIPIEFEGKLMTLTSIIDITSRKEAERKIKNAKLEAENANQAKSEFLSRMSHEFRTPMNSILGFAQLLDMGKLNPKQSKNVRQILKNGTHLLELINEVLDIARIEANRISLSMEVIKVSGVITEVLDLLRPMARERNVLFKIEQTDLFVISDYQRIKQVLLNLLNNAIKYNKQGGFVKVNTTLIEDENKEDMVRINIKDSGKGISEEDLKKIFEPFERVGVNTTEIEGSGLGLSIVKRLMDAMRGKMGVASTLGEGSNFWIEFPAAEDPVCRVEEIEIQAELVQASSRKSGNLLYIEDNSSNIDLMVQVLHDYRPGIGLITDIYGKNALQLAKDYRPFLILLDLNLPDIHGAEVVKLLKSDLETQSIPVVIVSADAMEVQIKKLMQEGVQSYLTKPVDIDELLRIIDRNLS